MHNFTWDCHNSESSSSSSSMLWNIPVVIQGQLPLAVSLPAICEQPASSLIVQYEKEKVPRDCKCCLARTKSFSWLLTLFLSQIQSIQGMKEFILGKANISDVSYTSISCFLNPMCLSKFDNTGYQKTGSTGSVSVLSRNGQKPKKDAHSTTDISSLFSTEFMIQITLRNNQTFRKRLF